MDGFMVGLDDVRELDWIPESEDEHEWVLTPEEILDALLNRPARAVSEGTTPGRCACKACASMRRQPGRHNQMTRCPG
jgi:hypothetical protein